MNKRLMLSLCAASVLYAEPSQEIIIEDIDISEQKVEHKTLSSSKQTVNLEEGVKPTTVTEALEKEFFVDFKKSSAYESEPYIRGRGNKGVPVYLEGMRLNAGHDDSTNLFNLSDAAEIEVYRGASGAELGMGAMSGAVVVKYKDPKFSDSSDFVTSGFADFKSSFLSKEGYSSTLGASFYNDLINFSLSGGLSDYDNYEDGEGDEILHSEYEAKNYNANFSLKTGDDSFVYFRYMKSESESSDPYTRFYNVPAGVWAYTDRPGDEGKNYFIGFKKANLGYFENFHIQGFKNDLHYDYNIKRESGVPYQQELYRDSETKGVKVSAEKTIDEHKLSFALKHSDMDLSNGLRKYDYATSSWGAWTSAPGITGGEIKSDMLNISDEIKYEKTFFNLAASYERVEREVESNIKTAAYNTLIPASLLPQVVQHDTDEKDDLLSVALSAGYEVSPAFIPYVKVSNATRTPYFNEQYGNNPSTGSQIPNQYLKNEKVYGIDLGADGKMGDFYYTSALYYQKYSDYIELANTGYVTTSNLPIKQFVNLDKAVVYGAELLAGYEIAENIFAEASYTYTRGENKDNDQPLAYISPQKLTLSIFKKQNKGLSWSIEQELVDAQDRISTVNGEKRTGGYGLTNASVSYGFGDINIFKDVKISLELNNIFDKNYREHLSKASSTAYYLPNEAGINGIAALQLKF